jgi:hypothetical protein
MENFSRPLWYKLIYSWVMDKGNTGLSIPFLVGAAAYLDKAVPDKNCIRELINDIVGETDIEYPVNLTFCRYISAYVLGMEQEPFHGNSVFRNADGEVSFINNAFGEHMEIEGIIEELEAHNMDHISDGLYSKSPGAFGGWMAFTADDIEFIGESVQGE